FMLASFSWNNRMHRFWIALTACLTLAVVSLVSPANSAFACPFCSMQGQTLTGEVNQASMVLFGTLTNAKLNADGLDQGSTDLQVEAVIKKNDILGDKKVVTLPRYIPSDKTSSKFLVFCDVFKGKIDPYRGFQPKEGWAYIQAILKDPKKEFMVRYAALRAVRFLWNSRPDLVPEKELEKGVSALLDQSDIADLAIEDLRLHKCWDETDHVFGLYGKKSHDIPIVRRYILRYALS